MSEIKLNRAKVKVCDYCEKHINECLGGSMGWKKNGFGQPIDFDICGFCIKKLYEEFYDKRPSSRKRQLHTHP